jgi:prepilin-type N-terminal cleavage/methylation domain-containing protein
MFMTKVHQEGFTLLEIIIAIAMLSLGILAIATMQVSAIKGNVHASGITEGITLAQERVEQLMPLHYNHFDLSDGSGDNDGQAGLGDDANADHQDPNNPIKLSGFGQQYNIYWNIAEDWPLPNTKTIRVIVTWTERGNQRSASLEFAKANNI